MPQRPPSLSSRPRTGRQGVKQCSITGGTARNAWLGGEESQNLGEMHPQTRKNIPSSLQSTRHGWVGSAGGQEAGGARAAESRRRGFKPLHWFVSATTDMPPKESVTRRPGSHVLCRDGSLTRGLGEDFRQVSDQGPAACAQQAYQLGFQRLKSKGRVSHSLMLCPPRGHAPLRGKRVTPGQHVSTTLAACELEHSKVYQRQVRTCNQPGEQPKGPAPRAACHHADTAPQGVSFPPEGPPTSGFTVSDSWQKHSRRMWVHLTPHLSTSTESP